MKHWPKYVLLFEMVYFIFSQLNSIKKGEDDLTFG